MPRYATSGSGPTRVELTRQTTARNSSILSLSRIYSDGLQHQAVADPLPTVGQAGRPSALKYYIYHSACFVSAVSRV